MQSKLSGPLIFFDFVNHFGGSFQSTAILIEELEKLTQVSVIDVYGSCSAYVDALHARGIDLSILRPSRDGNTYIGGRNFIHRFLRMVGYLPELMRIVIKLRRFISKDFPRAVWVNSEKALLACWLALPRCIPLVVYVRGELTKIRWYCLPAWRRANLALGVSKKSLHFLSSTDLAHRNFHIIYNGIDVDQTIRASKRGDTDIDFCWKDGLRFVLPASIGSPLKGHEVAIYALYAFLQQGNPAQLYICGDVPPGAPKGYYERLQQLVRELNLEKNVHFLGWRSDILAILGECDIVLLPSFTEGLPRSLLEAMALGKPVIATQVGGIPELIRNKIDGLLVPPGDVAALSDALHILSEPGLRGQMGRAAQKRVKEHFSLSTQAKNFLDAVEGVVGNL